MALDWPRLLLRMMGTRLPRTAGRLRVAGLDAPVTVRRDGWGIPHIDAASEADAWFALGFCQAQDRGFQLELLRRVGSGTLAALIGPDGLPIDRMSRRLGFRRTGEAQVDLLDPDVLSTLEAYAAGVNAGFAEGGRRPHELILLRSAPTPWTAADILAFVGLQAFALSGNWDVELARLKVLLTDGPDAVRDLEPRYAEWLPVTTPPGAAAGPAVDRLGADLVALQAVLPTGGASNNWAIAGSRTKSGTPLLANDPHLAATLPAPWYLAHLRSPGWEVGGASFVGGPAFPIGTNGHAAWGITAGLSDTTDLFLEEVGPDGVSVREGDAFVPCEVHLEQISVKGGEPVTERVLVTRRGPLITALLEETVPQALSMSARWLRPLPVRGFLDVVRARSFASFRASFADWPGPALNVAYADQDGHVGWQLVGQVPRRRGGNGALPLPGWDPAIGWEDDPVPFEEMPHCVDPTTGWVATANNRPIADGDGPFLGDDFIDGYRAARITEELAARDGWDVPAAQRLQMDVTSVPWRELREMVLALPVDEAGNADAELAIRLLTEWDGQVRADSVGATVFEAFSSMLTRRLARAKAPGSWSWAIGAGFGQMVPYNLFATRAMSRLVRLLRERPPGWFPGSTWEDQAIDALADAVRGLAEAYGDDPSAWRWGRLRTLTLQHPVGARRPFGPVFNIGPVEIGGDLNTPMQVASGPLEPFANPAALANTRCVMDLGDPERSRFSLAGGQSGNPLSPHYRDLYELWLRGEGAPIAWGEEAVAAATRRTLVLEPPGRPTPDGGR